MGASFGTIHVLSEDREEVKRAIETLIPKHVKRALIAPPINGWVTIFPEDSGQDQRVSEALARALANKTLIHGLVHDDDIFAYWYFEKGSLKDSYNSCPDYFDENNKAPRGGDAQAFAVLLEEHGKVRELQRLLDTERYTFEGERFNEFAKLLNLPNAATAYEYLQDGERDGIERWKEFIHVPDLTAERAVKRAAKAAATAELKRMGEEGLLIAESVGPKTGHPLFPASPVWCLDTAANSILLGWTGNPIGSAGLTPLNRVDPHTGNEEPTKVEVSGHVHCMTASPAGELVAVGCAAGDWKIDVWDIGSGKLIREISQPRAVDQVCFSADGQTLFGFSQGTITSADLKNKGACRSVSLSGGGQSMSLHPNGEHLVAVAGGLLDIVHVPTMRLVKTLWILDKAGPMRALIEKYGSQISQQFLEKFSGYFPAEEMAKQKTAHERHFLPKQSIFILNFTGDGRYLICGTSAGVCVLDWKTVLESPEMSSVAPALFAEAEPEPREDERLPDHRLIYSVPFDTVQRRVLFSGLEGKIRFLDLRDGRTGDLLVSPLRWPLWKAGLTLDRAAVVATAIFLREKGPKRSSPKFQIWSYPALCQRAGLDF